MWSELFAIGGNSTNYSTQDFTNVCDSTYGTGYVCRFVRNSFTTTKNKAVVASVRGVGPSGGADDVVATVVIDGMICGSNRFPEMPGRTGLASASCAQWVGPGTHTIDLVVFGATAVTSKPSTVLNGGVLIF